VRRERKTERRKRSATDVSLLPARSRFRGNAADRANVCLAEIESYPFTIRGGTTRPVPKGRSPAYGGGRPLPKIHRSFGTELPDVTGTRT